MSTAAAAVPDLLRRFAPTPHDARVSLNGIEIELHTDDVEIVAKMQSITRKSNASGSQASVLVRVIRDQDTPTGSSRITIISAAPLMTLFVGTDTVLVLDSERREILGFLASSISANRFADELLPLLLDRLKKVGDPASRTASPL